MLSRNCFPLWLYRRLADWAFTVIPRSRSTCKLSRTYDIRESPVHNFSVTTSYTCLFSGETSMAPTVSRILSASVLLPWSMWATMEKFLMFSGGKFARSTSRMVCALDFSSLNVRLVNLIIWLWHRTGVRRGKRRFFSIIFFMILLHQFTYNLNIFNFSFIFLFFIFIFFILHIMKTSD